MPARCWMQEAVPSARARSLGGPIRIILVILGLCARGDENTIEWGLALDVTE